MTVLASKWWHDIQYRHFLDLNKPPLSFFNKTPNHCYILYLLLDIYKLFKIPVSLYFVTECFTALTVNLFQELKQKNRPFFSQDLENSGHFFFLLKVEAMFLVESSGHFPLRKAMRDGFTLPSPTAVWIQQTWLVCDGRTLDHCAVWHLTIHVSCRHIGEVPQCWQTQHQCSVTDNVWDLSTCHLLLCCWQTTTSTHNASYKHHNNATHWILAGTDTLLTLLVNVKVLSLSSFSFFLSRSL